MSATTAENPISSETLIINTATDSETPDDKIYIYIILEYWYAEDVQATGGDGFQSVAAFTTLDNANNYAAAYQKHVLKEARKDLEGTGLQDTAMNNMLKCEEETKDDGTKIFKVNWAHQTEIVVKKMVLHDRTSMNGRVEMPFPNMLQYPSAGR